MGRRGPPKTPTAVLAKRGSWRAKTRDGEPQPGETAGRGRPSCPAWLRPIGKSAWKRLVPQLDAMGVLTTVDQDALAQWCETYAMWRECQKFLAKNGLTFVNSNGDTKAYPQAGQFLKLAAELNRIGAAFGLTPSARAGLNVTAIFRSKPATSGGAEPTQPAPINDPARFFK